MIDKEHIESFLRINQISLDAPEEHIREALFAARWREDDIEIALMTLRGEYTNEKTEHFGRDLHPLNGRMSPQAISSLLGINIDLQRERMQERTIVSNRQRINATFTVMIALITALILAGIVGLLLFYVSGAGPFYSPVEESLF